MRGQEIPIQPFPRPSPGEAQMLLFEVAGRGDECEPTKEENQEAQRIIDDPDIPCSDLRGSRDLSTNKALMESKE